MNTSIILLYYFVFSISFLLIASSANYIRETPWSLYKFGVLLLRIIIFGAIIAIFLWLLKPIQFAR